MRQKKSLFCSALLVCLMGCASDQQRLVRSQVAHLYLGEIQVRKCVRVTPPINCNVAAAILTTWKSDEAIAIKSSQMVCTGKASDACATHRMMPDVLDALARDRKAAEEAIGK